MGQTQTASFKAVLSMKECMLLYQLCSCSPKAAFLGDKYCVYVYFSAEGPAMQLDNEELSFPDLTSLGELETPVNLLSDRSLTALLLQLSLSLICLALSFRAV